MSRNRTIAPTSRTSRSAVSNRSHLLAGIDGRSASARRFRDLLISFTDDLGGADKISEAETALVRQAAVNVMESERQQAALVRGEPVDLEQLTRLTNATTRILVKLGIKRREKPRQSLADMLRGSA